MKIYAGIGSRKADPETCASIAIMAGTLEENGWFLRSGHADGCDISFEMGVSKQMEIHLPWEGYNNAHHGWPYILPVPTQQVADIAARHHPLWHKLSNPVKLLMCRNVTIVLGAKLDQPAKMVICWTPEGRETGGTAHGMKIAATWQIPVFNLANPVHRERLYELVNREDD